MSLININQSFFNVPFFFQMDDNKKKSNKKIQVKATDRAVMECENMKQRHSTSVLPLTWHSDIKQQRAQQSSSKSL